MPEKKKKNVVVISNDMHRRITEVAAMHEIPIKTFVNACLNTMLIKKEVDKIKMYFKDGEWWVK